jgi:hypothetical protein
MSMNARLYAARRPRRFPEPTKRRPTPGQSPGPKISPRVLGSRIRV